MSGILALLAWLIILGLGLAFYFLPTIVAAKTKHRSVIALFLLNLFLGWTVAGWVIALVWAFVKPAQVEVINRSTSTDELLKLVELRDRGGLTEEEFARKKEEILASEKLPESPRKERQDNISPGERVRRLSE